MNSVITVRNLASNAVPHLDEERFNALISETDERTTAQQQIVDLSDELINEVKQADALVIAAPMYNFSTPSQLKAWFDHLARVGVTFQYTATVPKGLLNDKPVYVICTFGGRYHAIDQDHQSPYIKQFFNLLGISNVQFIYAEGLNMGEESKALALETANSSIKDLVQAL